MRIHLNANPKLQSISFLGISLFFSFNAKQKLTQDVKKRKSGIKVEQIVKTALRQKQASERPKQDDKNFKSS